MAATIYDWSQTAASNSNSDADLTWAEGQSPGSVNNSAREMMRKVRQFVADIGGGLTAGGTANALTVTANSAFTSYADGQVLTFRAASANTGATTLSVNTIGAKSVRKLTWGNTADIALTGGELVPGGIYAVYYSAAVNSAAGGWVLANAPINSRVFHSNVSTASGTAWNFTSIPAGVTEITVMLGGFSTNGTSLPVLQIGGSGGIETSGYSGSVTQLTNAAAVLAASNSAAWALTPGWAASSVLSGTVRLSRFDAPGLVWIIDGTIARGDIAASELVGGAKTLATELDRVRVTTAGGVDTGDVGAIVLTYRY